MPEHTYDFITRNVLNMQYAILKMFSGKRSSRQRHLVEVVNLDENGVLQCKADEDALTQAGSTEQPVYLQMVKKEEGKYMVIKGQILNEEAAADTGIFDIGVLEVEYYEKDVNTRYSFIRKMWRFPMYLFSWHKKRKNAAVKSVG